MDIGGNYITSLIQQTTDSLKYQKLDSYSQQVKSMAGKSDPSTVEEAAKELEGQFISQLLGFMFNTVDVDPLFGGGFAEETLRSMMVDEYGKVIAQSGGIGIAEQVQKSLLGLQTTNNSIL